MSAEPLAEPNQPTSPIGPPSSRPHPGIMNMQDAPPSPRDQSDSHQRRPEPDQMRQGGYGPPPGYGGYQYPPYAPHPGAYGNPPHYGMHAGPGGYPPHYAGYPPHGYGGPRGPPYPGYGYEGGYPSQQSPDGRIKSPSPYRGGTPSSQQASNRPSSQQSGRKSASPKQGEKSSPTSDPARSSPINPPKLEDATETQRLRAAAATEISPEEVKPIQTDFHFFLMDKREKFRQLAEEEVRKTSGVENGELDQVLVNTNMNSRLIKAWEDLSVAERDAYMLKEEEDRRRFMDEDEIASRHCATLTARAKSPRSKLRVEEQREEDDCNGKQQQKREENEESEEDKAKKRSSPTKPTEEDESPSKRNRTEEDVQEE